MLKPLRQTECDSPSEVVKQINVLRAVTNDLAALLAKIAAPPKPPVETKTKTFSKGGSK